MIRTEFSKTVLFKKKKKSCTHVVHIVTPFYLPINYLKEMMFFINCPSMAYEKPGFSNFEIKFQKFEKFLFSSHPRIVKIKKN